MYRIRAKVAGQVVTMSHARVITVTKVVAKPAVSLKVAVTGKVGRPLTLTGTATGIASTASVQRQRLVNGVWLNLGSTAVGARGTWSMTVTPPKAANYTYRVALVVAGKVVAFSKTITVKVVA
jgi:hypothetical protein